MGRGRGGEPGGGAGPRPGPVLVDGHHLATCSTRRTSQLEPGRRRSTARRHAPATSEIDSPHGHDAFLIERRPGRPARPGPGPGRPDHAVTANDARRPADLAPRRRWPIRAGRVGRRTCARRRCCGQRRRSSPDRRRTAQPRGHARSAADRFYSRYGNPTVGGFEEAVAEPRGGRGGPGVRLGHGRRHRRGARAVLGRRPHRRPAPALRRHPAACSRRCAPGSGSTSPSSTAPSPARLAAAVRPGKTMLVFAETPANPRSTLVDLDELGAIAGPVTVVDSTFGTPLGPAAARRTASTWCSTRATKGIAGHNDATLGVVAGSKELVRVAVGFAVLQGRVGLALRRRSTRPGHPHRCRCASPASRRPALALASALEKRTRRATEVRYPGLAVAPAARAGHAPDDAPGGTLIAFDVVGGLEDGRASSRRCTSPSSRPRWAGPRPW